MLVKKKIDAVKTATTWGAVVWIVRLGIFKYDTQRIRSKTKSEIKCECSSSGSEVENYEWQEQIDTWLARLRTRVAIAFFQTVEIHFWLSKNFSEDRVYLKPALRQGKYYLHVFKSQKNYTIFR